MMASEETPEHTDNITGNRLRECPFCEGYTGPNLGHHISRAHPDEWADFDKRIAFVKTDEGLTVWWSE